MIDVPVNREIESYQEQVIMGLDLRKAIGVIVPIIICAISYMKLVPTLGTRIASWVCILFAAPTAIIGFFDWHGMHFEEIAVIALRFLLTKKRLGWSAVNYNERYFAAGLAAAQRRREILPEVPTEEGELKDA